MPGRNIKGITVEIGGDTTKLQDALKGVNKEINNTQAQLKDTEKLLKLDPGNTELLSQRQKQLGEAVGETKQKLETLKTAAEQANEALARGDISQEQYDALQREIVETEQELKRLEQQARESGAALQEIAAKGEKLKTVGDNISGVGEKFLPATVAVVGLGTAAVKTAADFDTGMSKVAAISGATGKDLDDLRAKAREMGAKTKFSASEAAAAMEYMAMAGWKTEDMLGGIEGIMNLAAASGEDLATTSDIVTDALTAFGMKADESAHFADIMAAASSNANTNVSLMGETFKYAAPVTGALGYTAEDTALAIGMMANAGIKGSQAGTAIRSGLTRLVKPTKQVSEAMQKYGISVTDSSGRMYTMREMMAQMRTKLGGLSEAEQGAAAAAIFGTNAMSGWLAIINGSEEDLNKLTTAIDNCDGKSEEMAATMQDNLEGQLTILKSQLEELAISFGEILMPVIRDIVSAIQGFVDKLNKLSPAAKKIIVTIALVVAAIGPVLIVIGKVVSAVGTIMTLVPKIANAIKVVKGAFTALNGVLAANPIILIIAAIAALVAAFIYLWNNCEEFREFWINLWQKVKAAAIAAWKAIKGFFTKAWTAIRATAQNVFNGIKNFLGGLWGTIKTTAVNAWNGIKDKLSSIWEGLKGKAETIWKGVKSTVTKVTDGISTAVKDKWSNIKKAYEKHGGGIEGIAAGTIEAVKGYYTVGFDALNNITGGKLNGIKDAVSQAMNALKTNISTTWTNIKTSVSTAMSNIKSGVATGWNTIRSTVSSVMGSIKSTVTTMWNSVKNGISNTIGNITTTIRNGFTTAKNFITNLASSAYNWGADIIRNIVNGIKSMLGNVRQAASDVASAIRRFLHFSVPDEGPLADFKSWMPDFMKGLASGIEKSRGVVKDAIGNVAGDMVVSPTVAGTAAMTNVPVQANVGNGNLMALLGQYLPYLPQLANMKVVTETGALVGELAPKMDERLGLLALRQRRQ